MVLFSIIIPVYNLEKYIEGCLNSVLNQNFNNYEIIVVDDGSSDESLSICQKYMKNNNRIKVYYKNNGGVSSARNYGMQFARGKYVLFLDGDDFLCFNALQHYASILEGTEYDLIICAKNILAHGKVTYHPHVLSRYKNFSCNNLMELFFESDCLAGAPWQYLYKRDNLVIDNVNFNCNYMNAEDIDFLFNYLIKERTYIICDEPLVTYRDMRDGSTTFMMSEKAIKSALEVIDKWYYFYFKNKKARTYFANQYCKVICQMAISKSECKSVQELIDINIVNESEGFKYYVLRWMWKIFGFKNGSKLLYRIKTKSIQSNM